MPGIVHPCSIGLNREVGKMAHPNQDLSSLDMLDFTAEETAELQEFAQFLESDKALNMVSVLSDSAPSSSSSSPSRDNESEGELPDSENALDLDKLWSWDPREIPGATSRLMLSDNYDVDLENHTPSEQCKLKRPSNNPFMGLQDNSPSDALLSHSYTLGLEDHQSQHLPVQNAEGLGAWGHTPPEDDEHILMLISSSMCDDVDADADIDESLPDTPSSYSGTVTGDDSDVDIETITDIPRTADACGYTTNDSSPNLSPVGSPSPLQSHANSNSISGLYRSSSSPLFSSSHSNGSKPLIRFNSCGVSSSASLAENLMCGRPGISSHKRKVHKEKRSSMKNTTPYSPPVYQSTGSSVNFHDYAMSPISCTSMETAQPTVLTSKRLCKRRQLNTLDLSEKEKQHHHNQLERNRRQKLADLFIDLRDVVPNIAHQTKASKVMILNQATAYIEDLQKHEGSQVQQISRELDKSEVLRRKLRQIQSQLSSVK